MAAIPELYATITSVNDPEVGWYQAEININPGFIVSGTSLKGSTFTVGEKVRIFQFLFWGSGAEFGFAKESEMEYSVCQFNQAFFEGVRNQNPHGFLLNWIAQKANNKKQMFGAGKIHSFITYPGIGNIGARVDLVSSSTRAILGFAADLNPNEFNLDDGVLVSYWPNPGRTIEGWWQTVGEDEGLNFNTGNLTMSLMNSIGFAGGSLILENNRLLVGFPAAVPTTKTEARLYNEAGNLIGSVVSFSPTTSEAVGVTMEVGGRYTAELIVTSATTAAYAQASINNLGVVRDLSDRVRQTGNTATIDFRVNAL